MFVCDAPRSCCTSPKFSWSRRLEIRHAARACHPAIFWGDGMGTKKMDGIGFGKNIEEKRWKQKFSSALWSIQAHRSYASGQRSPRKYRPFGPFRSLSVHASLRDSWGSHQSSLWLWGLPWPWPCQCLPAGLRQSSHVQWQRLSGGEQGHWKGGF